jgi:hypothetical protein
MVFSDGGQSPYSRRDQLKQQVAVESGVNRIQAPLAYSE